MAYRVNPDGSIDCPTAEEALNLQALILGRNVGQAVNGHGRIAPQERAEPVQAQVALPELARGFLRVLIERPRTHQEVAQVLNTTTASFPPMYRGLKKWATSAGVDYETLIVKNGDVLSVNEQARNIVDHALAT